MAPEEVCTPLVAGVFAALGRDEDPGHDLSLVRRGLDLLSGNLERAEQCWDRALVEVEAMRPSDPHPRLRGRALAADLELRRALEEHPGPPPRRSRRTRRQGPAAPPGARGGKAAAAAVFTKQAGIVYLAETSAGRTRRTEPLLEVGHPSRGAGTMSQILQIRHRLETTAVRTLSRFGGEAASRARAGQASPEAASGEDRVELTSAASRGTVGEGSRGASDFEKDGVLEDLVRRFRQEAEVQEALETGEDVEFTNSQGDRVSVGVTRTGRGEDGFTTYQVEVDARTVEVQVEDGVDPEAAIAATVDAWSAYPDELRGDLHTVRVHAGADPYYDPEDPNSVNAAARAGNGTISFFNGLRNLNQGTFDHEYGHVVGDATEDRQAGLWERFLEWRHGREVDPAGEEYIPEGYSDAAAADGNSVSPYGDSSASEEWADFWRLYVQARREGPEALARLEEEYPERFRIAEEVYEGEAAA